jgi:hypothetical protein
MKYKIFFIDNHSLKVSESEQLFMPCTGIFQINNEFIVYGEKGIFHFNDSPFNLNINSEEKLNSYKTSGISYKGGIQINENYIALTSNNILSKGEDKLVIYDIRDKIIINQIEGSYVLGVNGLAIIEIEGENKKVLLCGCKRYISGQKNGIMLIILEIKENKELKYYFNDTDDFEVNCFCQINKTNYFLVGGFENKSKGIIKLFKVYNDKNEDNSNNIEIEFIQDIIIHNDEFYGFNGAINSLLQLKYSGKILANCLDGKVYCFSKPNIDCYLCYDKDERND